MKLIAFFVAVLLTVGAKAQTTVPMLLSNNSTDSVLVTILSMGIHDTIPPGAAKTHTVRAITGKPEIFTVQHFTKDPVWYSYDDVWTISSSSVSVEITGSQKRKR